MHNTTYMPGEALGGRRRNKKRLKPLWWGLIIFVIIISAGVGGIYFLLYGEFFRIHRVTIEGARTIEKETLKASLVNQMAGAHTWRAWLGEQNILFWKLGGPSSLSATLFPALKTMEVKTNVWNKTVNIALQEREMIGMWCHTNEDVCRGFDKEGVAFSLVPNAGGTLILKITDENPDVVKDGVSLVPVHAWFEGMLKTIEEIKGSGLSIKKITIKPRALKEWQIDTRGGPTFHLPLDRHVEELPRIIERITKSTPIASVHYIDVRIANRVYYK